MFKNLYQKFLTFSKIKETHPSKELLPMRFNTNDNKCKLSEKILKPHNCYSICPQMLLNTEC